MSSQQTQTSQGAREGRIYHLQQVKRIPGGFPGGSEVRVSAWNAGDLGSIPGSGRSGEGNGNPLQYSFLENSMDRGAWGVIVHGVTKSWMGLSNSLTLIYMYL